MLSPNQARGGKSRPGAVTMNAGFKTNVPMTMCKCTPTAKTAAKIYPVNASMSVRTGN